MRLITAILFSLLSVSAFASSVEDTISSIEFNKNVKCEHVKSSFAFCYGTGRPFNTCKYTSTYSCVGQESFVAKLSVKEFTNNRTQKRDTTVTKVSIK